MVKPCYYPSSLEQILEQEKKNIFIVALIGFLISSMDIHGYVSNVIVVFLTIQFGHLFTDDGVDEGHHCSLC